MTILLGFKDYGDLNIFDDCIMEIIKSFLSSTPNEEMIEIHKEMKKYRFRPYNKKLISFWKVHTKNIHIFYMETETPIQYFNNTFLPKIISNQNQENKKVIRKLLT